MERVCAVGYGFFKGWSRWQELAVLHIKIAEFLVIPCRRIVANRSLEFTDALAARKHLEGLPQQSHVGENLDNDVNERPQRTEEEDDENPIHVRPSPDEVDDGEYLEQQAPGKQKMTQKPHA